jgi:thiamine biosynthesis lipoprotein
MESSVTRYFISSRSTILRSSLILQIFLTLHLNITAATSKITDTTTNWIVVKGMAQGTTYTIKYYSADHVLAKDRIDSLLTDVDRSLSRYREDSRISLFNRSLTSSPSDNHLSNVLSVALQVQSVSNGSFDIRLYNISQAWGFGPYPAKRPPSRHKIKRLKPRASDTVWLSDDFVNKSQPNIRIDLDGLAQGYTVDQLADLLHEHRISDYMVELGGEIRTSGFRQDGTRWKIGVEAPQNTEDVEMMMVAPGNGAITTSGSYRKTRTFGRRTYSHVIDPRTCRPIENGMLSCTVIAPNAMLADALDNVGMVLGPTEAMKVFASFPCVEAFFVWRDLQGVIRTHGTPGFFEKILDEDS